MQNELSAIQNLSQKIVQNNQKLERDITECLQTQLATQNGIAGWKRDGARLRALISEKESQIATTQNDLSATRLETLDTSARLQSLVEQAKRIDEECVNKSQLMEKYEQEMKRRNDELGKKSSEMDLLNRKLEQLTGGDKDSSSIGPLEATIRNLTNSIKAKEKECTQLSHYWLRAQNELVLITKKTSDIMDESQDLKMKLAVLTRKKMVVNST